MRKAMPLLFFLLYNCLGIAQESSGRQSGYFSVTRRSSVSMWGMNDWKFDGLGVGTAFRIQISKRLNSEWYGDHIKTQYKGKAYRMDRHLTMTLMYYLRDLNILEHQLHPFITASVFCLDQTKIYEVGGEKRIWDRFSFSQQLGMGTHYFVTEKFDVSLYMQYYNHLGNHIHIEEKDDGTLHVEHLKERISLEGHMFFVASVGYRLADLWGKRNKTHP